MHRSVMQALQKKKLPFLMLSVSQDEGKGVVDSKGVAIILPAIRQSDYAVLSRTLTFSFSLVLRGATTLPLGF